MSCDRGKLLDGDSQSEAAANTKALACIIEGQVTYEDKEEHNSKDAVKLKQIHPKVIRQDC